MAYIPHTPEDTCAMLKSFGVQQTESLFSTLPDSVRLERYLDLPAGLSEPEAERTIRGILAKNQMPRLSFAGGGAYEHYIPSAVKSIISRGEFLTAYTPYQAEASQGSLQAFYEFQTVVCQLTGLDYANASLYDAGSALAEAVLMAWRVTNHPRVFVAPGLNPLYRRVLETYTSHAGVLLENLPERDGIADFSRVNWENTAAVVVQHPNYLGCLEQVEELAARAKSHGAMTIAVVNPVSLGLLKPPGDWGADIAVGDCQPLGLPLSFGGPYAGFMAVRAELVRKMPGRIVGVTVDKKGRRGFVLTLQAREQHIRREKASSNICSNQALCALAFTVCVALRGGRGLRDMASACAVRARKALERLLRIPGVKRVHNAPFFHEFVLELPFNASAICSDMARHDRIVPGVPLSRFGSARERELIVCATETKSLHDIDELVRGLAGSLGRLKTGGAK